MDNLRRLFVAIDFSPGSDEALRRGETLVTTGPAGTALIEVASERKADLIVVGTIGPHRFASSFARQCRRNCRQGSLEFVGGFSNP